ncbi:MAG: PE family protein, partial [Methylocystaceae bacterium]
MDAAGGVVAISGAGATGAGVCAALGGAVGAAAAGGEEGAGEAFPDCDGAGWRTARGAVSTAGWAAVLARGGVAALGC